MSMVLDYSERKPVGKNRPRKQPVGMFVLILLGAISVSYVLGLTTGWFRFTPKGKTTSGQSTSVAAGPADGGATAAQRPTFTNPDATASHGGSPPLTFYETLPKGGKAVIGSGLNPKKTDALPEPHPAASAPLPPQAANPQTVAPAASKPEVPKEKLVRPDEHQKKGIAPPQDGAGKFCVQVASSQDRNEADALRDKLVAKGFSAYVEESKITGKGTWYRVRIGRHLSQQAAGELAGKAGKGSLVIPE